MSRAVSVSADTYGGVKSREKSAARRRVKQSCCTRRHAYEYAACFGGSSTSASLSKSVSFEQEQVTSPPCMSTQSSISES